MKQPKVDVIVLNYNGEKFLKNCLDTLKKTTYKNYRVILVDNASSDRSLEIIRSGYMDYVALIENKDNLGFVKANNQVMAADGDADYFVLLNNDTEVEPDWLTELVKVAEQDPSIGALQPKLKSLRDREKFDYNGASGGYFDRFGYTVCRGRVFDTIEQDKGQYDDSREVFWAGGPAIFLRKSTLAQTGLLNDSFGAYFEEIDLCWRIRLAGYRILCVPDAVVFHYWGAANNPGKRYLNQRNNLLTLFRNYSTLNLVKYFPARLCFDFINLGYAVVRLDTDWAKAILKSFGYVLTHGHIMIRERKEIQKTRKVKDSEITRLMVKSSIIKQYFLQGRRIFTELDGLPVINQ